MGSLDELSTLLCRKTDSNIPSLKQMYDRCVTEESGMDETYKDSLQFPAQN